MTPLEALDVRDGFKSLGKHQFWPLARAINALPKSIRTRLQGYRQITDALLLATAIQQGGQMVTLDTGLKSLVPDEHRSSLRVLRV